MEDIQDTMVDQYRKENNSNVEGGGDKSDESEKSEVVLSGVHHSNKKCFICKKKEHIAKIYPLKRSGEGKAGGGAV